MNHRLAVVTGGSGFVGSNLCQHLRAAGYPVRALLRRSSSTDRLHDLDIEQVRLDFESPEALADALSGATHVFHVAGRIAGSPAALQHANAEVTERLARTCMPRLPPPVFLYVSSLAAVGPAGQESPVVPETPAQPISDYGRSKREAERRLQRLADFLPISIVRPGIVFGPHDKEFLRLPKTMRSLRFVPLIGRVDPPLAMIHVHDLCRLLIAAAERGERLSASGSPGEGVYLAADPQPMSLAEVGQLLRTLLRRPRAVDLRIPVSLAYSVAAVAEGLDRLRGRVGVLNRDKIREATREGWVCDPSKSMQQLSWQPEAPLAERLAQTVEWAFRSGQLR